ncbi:hypothetical protein J6524_25425 [Bradyrhizobium sp. WSM 1738]|uniref:hypothetical protein n=1 Tax=Bradyrhizobium hereditatis TaxID=2821405 RepID=UPI001CE381AF|nr:hypothetical protein [Bradyrhizobium hereditatis]MCA6118191.1 hypothetical protein [Bradyrhizobium hereditatis]
MAKGVGGVWAGLARCSGAKLQHLAAFSGGWQGVAVTGLTIHDIVMAPALPVADLFQ